MAGSSPLLRLLVLERTGQDPFRCYQCGNCSAGCPMAGKGDLLPHQVLRHLQLDSEEPLHSVQPWLCVGCQTCATRCPQELDLAQVMDALRSEALRRRTVPAEARRMAVFNTAFVNQVRAAGRLSEVALGAVYNLRSGDFFANLQAVPGLLRRGKIRLGGRKVRGPGRLLRDSADRRAP
jgi:heterodisulfide reductase subunit C